MSVATLLTQPRLVEKLASNDDPDNIETLAEDIIALIRRLLANPEKAQPILASFIDGFERFGNDFINNATDFNGGIRQLTQLMQPLADEIKSFGNPDAFD
ncbi:MAG: hypothetical protein R3208_16705, partial [Ketobacteraceae bacterium]|nr:hypothetical protein [Ketobacteraceae bacterium]